MNTIKNCPVTVDDIKLAEKIYGPDVATIKGKATRSRPTPVVNDIIEIPKELIAAQHDVELSIDTLFVNSMSFVATISHNIKYRTCNFVPSRRMLDYRGVLARVVLIYTNAGFTIKMIHADSEYRAVLVQSPPPEWITLSWYGGLTQGIITRRKVKGIPITASVIEAVERLAKADGIKSLVLNNKDGTIFYDSSWITGVDHTQNDDYDNIYDDSDYESQGSETDVDLEPDYDAEQDFNDEHEDSQENLIQEELSYANQSIDDEDIDEGGDGIDQLDLIFQENNNENEEEEQNEETEHDAISKGSILSRTDGKELQSKAL
ncbi:hypothetical protein IV203_023922 [Nitzschia inconspicua]|uniref:Uncharacterized protein n=1 Tax=Nitzschia inconspicua TaxID=303405 RepID=A0A9K3PCT7_9STRA|nr:hypothetical protein IV203_023922 [Nitzschia inconspicua]